MFFIVAFDSSIIEFVDDFQYFVVSHLARFRHIYFDTVSGNNSL